MSESLYGTALVTIALTFLSILLLAESSVRVVKFYPSAQTEELPPVMRSHHDDSFFPRAVSMPDREHIALARSPDASQATYRSRSRARADVAYATKRMVYLFVCPHQRPFQSLRSFTSYPSSRMR